MSFESSIRTQKSLDSESNGGSPEASKPASFHEAFLRYQQARTQKERIAVFLEEWLPLCQSLSEILEFKDHLSADNPEYRVDREEGSMEIAIKSDEDALLDLNEYLDLYAKTDKKLVELYLAEVERAGSIPELKAMYKKLDDRGIVYKDGRCEIPTLRKWFEFETTKAGLIELLKIIRNDFLDQNLPKLVDLKRDIWAKLAPSR